MPSTAAADVQAALVKRVLPALSEQLIVKNEVTAALTGLAHVRGSRCCASAHTISTQARQRVVQAEKGPA